MKLISASDLIDKPVICPICEQPAVLRKDDQGYWVECKGDHRPAVAILAMTSLQVPEEKDEAKAEVKP